MTAPTHRGQRVRLRDHYSGLRGDGPTWQPGVTGVTTNFFAGFAEVHVQNVDGRLLCIEAFPIGFLEVVDEEVAA